MLPKRSLSMFIERPLPRPPTRLLVWDMSKALMYPVQEDSGLNIMCVGSCLALPVFSVCSECAEEAHGNEYVGIWMLASARDDEHTCVGVWFGVRTNDLVQRVSSSTLSIACP